MNKPTVVVTGASGFLGSHLVQQLQQYSFPVIPLSRQLGFDICSGEIFENIPKFNVLVHLAARTFVPDSYNKTASFLSTNINGTLNALELCKKNKAHFIFASSYLYGPPNYLPVDEKHPVSLWNPYASSKIIGEQLCQTYSKEFKIHVDILRIFNIYGPGQNPTFVIPKIVAGVLNGTLDLETGTPKRDFVYVTDVCNAIMRCLDYLPGQELYNVYNVGTGTSYSVNQIIQLTEKLTGKKANVTFTAGARTVEVPDVKADYSKIKKEKGWEPLVEIEDGLMKIITGFKEKN